MKKSMKNPVKQLAAWFLSALLLFCLLPPGTARGEESFTLYARSAVLMDGDSGRILYGKEEDNPLPMASTTKIMTCILALEEGEEDLVCVVSSQAAAQPPVKLGMVREDSFYLKDLLYSLMLESHNDTAVCIAESVAGSVEEFAARMNGKAKELGCTDTHYITPNGLDAEDGEGVHHTTAAELARVMRYCITQSPKASEFLEITGTISHSFSNLSGTRSYSCTNHNTFLTMMDGALSGKTGFTGNAGYCYVGAVRKDGKLLIVALLACGWPNNRGYKWADTKKLMNYGLNNYEKRLITDLSLATGEIQVEEGQQEAVSTHPVQEKMELLMRKDETVERKIELAASLTAPVKAEQQVGNIQYLVDGTLYAQYPVVASRAVEKIDFFYCLEEILKKYLLSNANFALIC